ncbi:MAG: universal stress protein, partial [Thermodesulfobacteriota bacterium]|nr:universal stress protein [Thermodesulfobacteriota bacterium]
MSQKILIPLDGSALGEAALHHVEEMVSTLALESKVEVILFQVVTLLTYAVATGDEAVEIPYTPSELEQIKAQAMDYLSKAAECLEGKGVTVRCEVAFGTSSAEEIIKAEAEVEADLVAMSTHGRHGITRLAFGSVTDKVLRRGKTPVLIVRMP